MKNVQTLSPTSLKLKAVKNDLSNLDAEINEISQELSIDDNNYSSNINFNDSFSFSPIKQNNSSRKNSISKNNSNLSAKSSKTTGTPRNSKFDSTLQLEDLMSETEINNEKNQKFKYYLDSQLSENRYTKTNCYNPSDSYNKINMYYDSNNYNYFNQYNASSKSLGSSIYGTSNNYNHTEPKIKTNDDSSKANEHNINNFNLEDIDNRMFIQSVSILQNRSHTYYNQDFLEHEEDNVDFYFPKKYYNSKIKNYKSLTEDERIKESQKKRDELKKGYLIMEEQQFREDYPFQPIKSTPPSIISPEREKILRENYRKKKDKKILNILEENEEIAKNYKFIDPNSERIAKKAESKLPIERVVRGLNYKKSSPRSKLPKTPQPKTLSKKEMELSIKRLTKVRKPYMSDLDDPDQYSFSNEDSSNLTPKKYHPEEAERLFQDSIKPKDVTQEPTPEYKFQMNPNSKIIAEKARRTSDLFENSVRIAEENFLKQKQAKEFREKNELIEYTFRPQINRTPPNFDIKDSYYKKAETPTYQSIMKSRREIISSSENSSSCSTPRKTRQRSTKNDNTGFHSFSNKSNSQSPFRKTYIDQQPKKTPRSKVSNQDIESILSEVDYQLSSNLKL